MKWTSGIPVSYLTFGNVNFKNLAPDYRCNVKNVTHCNGIAPSPCVDLSEVKSRTYGTLYPVAGASVCTLMLLSNLAEVEWVNIDCYDKLLAHTLCVNSRMNTQVDASNRITLNKPICSASDIAKGQFCYRFKWKQFRTILNILKCSKPVNTKFIVILEFLFEAIATPFPLVLLPQDSVQASVQTYQHDKYFTSHAEEETFEAQGFYVCQEKQLRSHTKQNIFKCKKGGFVAFVFVCDDKVDCPNDRSDELFCKCRVDKHRKNNKRVLCKSVTDVNGRILCGSLYFVARDKNCHKFVDLTSGQNNVAPKQDMFCKGNIAIDAKLWNDLIPDCTEAEDELYLTAILEIGFMFQCNKVYELPCRFGHSKCFNISDICSYKLDKNNFQYPCQNGGHIENCNKFECNVMFKCWQAYCIPWSYVCDRKWDCPTGDEESYKPVCGTKATCINMLRCINMKHNCIHLQNVCDGEFDCMLGDDEMLC